MKRTKQRRQRKLSKRCSPPARANRSPDPLLALRALTQPAHASPTAANPEPEPAPRRLKRRHYKVDRLPPDIQQMIARLYADGASFLAISQQVTAAGHPIGKGAIRKYWHAVWKQEHEELLRGRLALVAIERALRLGPDSESGKIAQEILYTLLCGRLPELKQQPWDVLLREAREQQKLGGGRKKPAPNPLSGADQAREVRRRWRNLYGLEDKDEGEEGQARPRQTA